MTIKHIVLFQFKADAAQAAVDEAVAGMLSLQTRCLQLSTTQQPYIRSLSGGRDCSTEGLQNGIQYAFVAEFDSLADRDYYVKEDPAHKAFVAGARPLIEKAIVVDYAF